MLYSTSVPITTNLGILAHITKPPVKKQSSDFQTFTRKRNYSNKYLLVAINNLQSIATYQTRISILGNNVVSSYTSKELERLEKIIKDIQEFRKDLSKNNPYSFKELNP